MATTMVDSWAVDLATIGPIYPWVGSEVVLWVLGLAFWIGWHIWQGRFESRTYEQELRRPVVPALAPRAGHPRRETDGGPADGVDELQLDLRDEQQESQELRLLRQDAAEDLGHRQRVRGGETIVGRFV